MGKFSDQIRQFNIDFSNLSDEVFRVTTIKFFGQIVQASPVDTGRFRANWFATISRPSTKIELNSKKSEDQVNQRIEQKINGSRESQVFWLTNNLPYSEVIEFGGYDDGPKTKGGFSRQAPKGVVRITAKRFSKIFNENASRLSIKI